MICAKANVMKKNYTSSNFNTGNGKSRSFFTLILTIFFLLTGKVLMAQSQGPFFPSSSDDVGTGAGAWANTTRLLLNDNSYTTVSLSGTNTSWYIYGVNYQGFNIPATAVIDGIIVTIGRLSSGSSGNSIKDVNVRMIKSGAIDLNANRANATRWGFTETAQTYGSATDLWGTTWTPAQINAADFGAALSVQAEGTTRTASVDYISITVHYTLPPTISSLSPASTCVGTTPTITITGTNFKNITDVQYNGVSVGAANYTVDSTTQIRFTLPAGVPVGTGVVRVINTAGNATRNFTVNPLPTVNATTGPTGVCVNGTINLANTTGIGVWSVTPLSIATISSGGVVTGVSAGNAVVKYTVTNANGCINSVDYPITVNTLPILNGPATVCSGSQIQLTSAFSGVWSGGNASATIDPLTGMVTGLSGGTTTFTFTTTGTNCQNTKTITVYTLPAITTQPVAISRCSGTSAAFTTVGSGTGVTYQWYKDGNPINLATGSSYNIASVTLANAGNYHCVVSGSCTPAVTSDIVALSVTQAVSISAQPVSIQKCTNEMATFSVTAGGEVFGYQWYKDGNPIADGGSISGAATSSLTIASPVASDAGIYRCQILGTGPCPALNSANATLTVYQLPAINTQPVGLSRCSGTSATFTVGTSGTGITYQWYKDGNPITLATNSSYTIASVTVSDSGNYHCIVSGTCTPSVISDIVPLTVTQALGISANPVSLQKCINDTANFSITATGAISGYQWYKDGIALTNGGNISGATASALVITPLVSGDAGIYHCEVIGTGPCPSVLSANAALIVNDPPVITNQTTATQIICFGQSAGFHVTATGGNLLYQWYNGSTALNNSVPNISGWNTATLTINPANVSDSSASYHCVISNACSATATTANMTLIVNSKPVIPNQNTTVCSGLPFAVEPVDGVPTSATVVPLNTMYSWSAPTVTGGITGGTAQSGQPVISDILINPGTTSETATYTVTPVSGTSGNCVGNSFTVVVTVNPVPHIINLTRTTCSGEIFSITPVHGSGNSVPSGTTYSWGIPVVTGGMTGGNAQVNQSSISQTLINPTNQVQTATYTITAKTGNCVGSTFSMVITVNPKPTVGASILSQTICSGDSISAITLSNPNNVPGTSYYNWTRNNPLITGIPNASGNVIAGILTNTTTVQQTTTFTVYATSEEGCISLPITLTVTVKPKATITATPSAQSICSGTNASIVLGSNISGTVFSWTHDNPNITGATGSSPTGPISGILTNTTNIPQTTTFTIQGIADGCPSTTTATVTVNPVPTIAATTSTPSICSGTGFTVQVTNPNNVAGTTFSWAKNNAAVTASSVTLFGNTLSGTLTNTTTVDQTVTFTLTATALGCPSATTQVQVVVKPLPNVTAPATLALCSGTNMSFNFTGLSGTVYSFTWTNTGVSGTPILTGNTISGILTNSTTTPKTATFTISGTLNGCTSTAVTVVTVNPSMTVAPVISDDQIVCQGSRPAPFIITTPPVGGSGTYTYQWQSSTTSVNGPWTPISGATASSYQPPVTNGSTPNTWYSLIITSCGTQQSNAVLVTVGNNGNFAPTITWNGGLLCPGANFNPYIATLHSWNVSVRYSWVGDPAYISPPIGNPIGSTFGVLSFATLPLTVMNNTNANVTTTLSIILNIYNDDGDFVCSLSPQYFPVTIRPKPTATAIAPSLPLCSGQSGGISVSGNLPTMTFNWVRTDTNANVASSQLSGNATVAVAGNTFSIPDVLTNSNTSNVLQPVTYQITPYSASCTGTPITVTIYVNPRLNPGTLATDQVICYGGDPAAFTQITAPTGGASYTYQWQSSPDGVSSWNNIGGETSAVYDVPNGLTTTTWYRRIVTSIVNGVTCSIANNTPLKITVNTITTGSISGSITICANTIPSLTGTVASAPSGSTVTYQWQISTTDCNSGWSNIGSPTTNPNYTIPTGISVNTYYRRIAISTISGVSCSSGPSNCVSIIVNRVTAGTVAGDQILCNTTNPAAFTESVPATGSGVLTYQWQSNTTGCGGTFNNISGALSATYDAPTGLTVTTYYQRVTTSTLNGVSCSVAGNCITVTPSNVTGGVIDGNRTVCLGGDPSAFTSIVPGVSANLQYQWQSSPTGLAGSWTDIPGAQSDAYDVSGPVTQIMFYQRITSDTVTGCSAASNYLTVFVNDVTPSTVSGSQTICGTDPAAFTQTVAASGYGTISYQWQRSTVGCSGPWNNITGAISNVYDPPMLTDTTYYHVLVTSTINGSTCTVESNCITVQSYGKTWDGSESTDWYTDDNWTPVGVPTAQHCVVIPNVFNDPIISGANMDAYANNLTILNGGKLDVSQGQNITVTDLVTVNSGGQFLLQDDAGLIQINNVNNVGIINMTRITQPMYRYDFTYWGSPLTLSSNFKLGGPGGLSPDTLSDKYFSWVPTVGNNFGTWNYETSATVMDPTKGYIVRAPQYFSPVIGSKAPYTAHFIGTPNNGDILSPIYHGTQPLAYNNDKYNLLGNPYPSAIDAEKFLSDPANIGVINGTIHFWTHNSPPSTAYQDPFYGDYIINYTDTDYASFNRLGGTGTTAAATTGGAVPAGFIAAGQGFFTKSTGTAPSGTPVVFRNSMRVSGNNGQFFRTSQTERHRIWLNLMSNSGGFNQILVGYATGATEGIDRDFDGTRISDASMTLYSICEGENLIIQGRSLPFNVEDQIAIGYKALAPDTYSIRIDHLDGLFENQNVYVEDKLVHVIHNLKSSPYIFTSNAGTFNDRFILRYTDALLSASNPDETQGLIAFIKNEKLVIKATDTIRRIYVYDLTGKLIRSYTPDEVSKDFKDDFNGADGIYMVKIKLIDGSVITRKLINKK